MQCHYGGRNCAQHTPGVQELLIRIHGYLCNVDGWERVRRGGPQHHRRKYFSRKLLRCGSFQKGDTKFLQGFKLK